MKNKIRCIWVVILSTLALANAEMRIWTSLKGDTIEAEYVNIMGNKVVLKKGDGKQIQVPLKGLSKADQTFLAALIPPTIQIEVDVEKKTDKPADWDGYVRKNTRISCEIELKKKSKAACNRDFTACIYVFAEDIKADFRKVILKKEHTFNFKSRAETVFETDVVELMSREGLGLSKEGLKYDGYIVILADSKGEVITTKSSSKTYDEYVHRIKKCKVGDWCSRAFKVTEHKQSRSYWSY